MDGGMFRGFAGLIRCCFGIMAIALPLAVWKLIEIGVWLLEWGL